MTIKQGGTTANYTGTVLEKFILDRLFERGYSFIQRDRFIPAKFLEQPIFTRKFHVSQSVYDTPQYCDFILYHPQKWKDGLVIECKWQNSSGSVDEKYPYLVLNIQMKYPCPTIVLLDGKGYKKGAEKWLRSQAGNSNFLHVFNMSEFTAWVNKENI